MYNTATILHYGHTPMEKSNVRTVLYSRRSGVLILRNDLGRSNFSISCLPVAQHLIRQPAYHRLDFCLVATSARSSQVFQFLTPSLISRSVIETLLRSNEYLAMPTLNAMHNQAPSVQVILFSCRISTQQTSYHRCILQRRSQSSHVMVINLYCRA